MEVKSVPSTEKKEAVVAKSKMAVMAGSESRRDAAQNVIRELFIDHQFVLAQHAAPK